MGSDSKIYRQIIFTKFLTSNNIFSETIFEDKEALNDKQMDLQRDLVSLLLVNPSLSVDIDVTTSFLL